MMEVGSYSFHRRARGALHELAADEQAQVLDTLARLPDTPAALWPSGQAKRIPGDEPLYLVPVDDSLRLIIQAADGQEPEVQGIVRRETLEFFRDSANNTARPTECG
jgi:hypothetical protein